MSLLSDLLAAHLLRFERPERTSFGSAAGARLLVAFVLVGLVLQPALAFFAPRSGLEDGPWAGMAIVVTLLVATALAMRVFVRLTGGNIGLHRWEAWTRRERIYALTVIPLAAAVFGILFREHFANLFRAYGGGALLIVLTGLLWGIAQEIIYRGLLQTVLVRRLGGIAGVLLANLVFTFGPLHFNHYGFDTDYGVRWGMFAAIFGIGLFFGVLYRRSGNLWIPALMHGLWPLNMA